MDDDTFFVSEFGVVNRSLQLTRFLFIITAFVVVCIAAAPAFAEWTQPLRSAQDADEFCRYSKPVAGDRGDVADTASRDEAYDSARRNRVQRPIVVWVEESGAPVIGYDRVAGVLEFSFYRPSRFTDRHAVQVSVGAIPFETTEEKAHEMWARYEAGTARLKLTFLPAAWSEYERPLCRKQGELLVLEGEVLRAELVDEVDRELIGFETELGHEVAMMHEHRIQGYLDTGIPIVAISTLTPFPPSRTGLNGPVAARLKASMRAALYGCYLKGLGENARLQGALVVKLTFADKEPTILVDSLHDAQTSSCAVRRLAEFARSDELVSDETALKATLIFRLEEAGSL